MYLLYLEYTEVEVAAELDVAGYNQNMEAANLVIHKRIYIYLFNYVKIKYQCSYGELNSVIGKRNNQGRLRFF